MVADTVDSGTRYRLLETTRAYALEALGAAGETAALERRHGAYFRDLFAVAEQDENRLTDTDWRLAYVPERDNLRAAFDRAFAPGGDPEIGVALAGACVNLRPYVSVVEFRQRLAVAQPHVDAGLPPAIVARFCSPMARHGRTRTALAASRLMRKRSRSIARSATNAPCWRRRCT